MLVIARLELESVLRVAVVAVYLSRGIVRETYIAYRHRFFPIYYLCNSYLDNRRDCGLYSYILHRLRRRIVRNIPKTGLRYLS
jgi:hypothetical protein